MEILNKHQKALLECLLNTGIDRVKIIHIMGILWEEQATLEMLNYWADNYPLDQAELYSTALKISKKYPIPDEEE